MLTELALCWRLVHPSPDYNLMRRAEDGGMYLRRIEWHVVNAAITTGASYAISRIFHKPKREATLVALVTTKLIPHFAGSVLLCRYDLNLRDQAADAWIAALPAFYVRSPRNLVPWAAGYWLLSPYASP